VLPLFIVLVACTGEPGGDLVAAPDAGLEPPQLPGEPDAAPSASADPDVIPRFATAFYLDLAHVERISRFRAGIGHDYSDSYERCRSMKHYSCPLPCPGSGAPLPAVAPPPWTELQVRSPITGTLVRLDVEQTFGTQLVLEPEGHPDFRVKIFHVTPASELAAGSTITAGQLLGTHASTQTMSDIAVEQGRPDGFRLISFFETLSDEAFVPLGEYGITSRAELQISPEERDAAPLTCDGEQFMAPDSLEEWVALEH
jgi:hypothetical protein